MNYMETCDECGKNKHFMIEREDKILCSRCALKEAIEKECKNHG